MAAYDPAQHEKDIYKQWEESGAFQPDLEGSDKHPYTIIMPPPNANGVLHAGHAVGYTLEDVAVRYHRLNGHPTLWQPGTDHAGIETQFVYEKKLKQRGLNRHDLGREKFNAEVMDFTLSSQDTVLNQFRSMGFSADWSRLKFTLDTGVIDTVYDTFIDMYNQGHIYRGRRIVNWCPTCGAAFADIEVEREEAAEPFYTFKYGPFEIATSRPETKFGDKYVVMHPDDERYSQYNHGDTFEAEWLNGKITATVIKDDSIDMDLGTGVMTITPWHDATDFAIAEKNDLDKQQIIDEKGKLLPIAGEFAGMPILEARPKIVEKLDKMGLLVKTEERQHALARHDRCGTLVEPQISLQWFVAMEKLNQPVITALENDEIVFHPKRYKKIALDWLRQEHDWCISRQNWWGIQMPIYYGVGDRSEEVLAAKTEKEAEAHFGAGNYKRETDIFDTWFSSGQWPYATLKNTRAGDFERFYPTSLMGTGRDILHKWVTRMVMFGLYATQQVPFKEVYLWGLVTDEKGQKMSKSKGNGLDPLQLSSDYGTDALRFAAALSNTPGNNSPLGPNMVEAQRNFCNKLWNVSRYVEYQAENQPVQEGEATPQTDADHWMLSRIAKRQAIIEAKFNDYRLNEAAHEVYHLIWSDLADWYVEAQKAAPNPLMLCKVLHRCLITAHPFVPFITEAIWQDLGYGDENNQLISASWPKAPEFDQARADKFSQSQDVIQAVRSAAKAFSTAKKTTIVPDGSIGDSQPIVEAMTKHTIKMQSEADKGASGVTLAAGSLNIQIVASEAEKAEYEAHSAKQKAQLLAQIKSLEGRLSNKSYVDNAPAELVAETKSQLQNLQQQLQDM